MAAIVSDVLANPSKAADWPYEVYRLANIPKRGHVLVAKPIVYLELVNELRRFLLTGIVPGTCQYCPHQTINPDQQS